MILCCPVSPLLAFVQTWLDEYSEDFRDPPLHAALRLLLDHLRISSAVHDNMHTQPNFCSLAAQAEALLMKFQKEGDPPAHNVIVPCDTPSWWLVDKWNPSPESHAHFFLFWFPLCVSSEGETNVSPAQADLEQDEEGSGDEDSGCENFLDQGSIMDFPAVTIAEQLTRMDSVRARICFKCDTFLSLHIDVSRLMFGFHGVSGSVCQSGAVPVPGLRVVPKRQEGKHVPHHPCHHYTVQHRHKPGHNVTALPADRRQLQSHLPPPACHYASSKGPHHREVDPSSTGQSKLKWVRLHSSSHSSFYAIAVLESVHNN